MEREYLYNKSIMKNHNEIENQKIGKWFFFSCKNCNKIFEKRIGSSKMENFFFLCCKCKRTKTNLTKYGVENPFQSDEIKKKLNK